MKRIKKYLFSLCATVIFAFCGIVFAGVKETPITANASSHNCALFGTSAQGIGQSDVSALLENSAMLPAQDEPYRYYLTEDVAWEGVYTAPDGVMMAICLNGHTATGTVNNEGTTGGVYFFQCGIHYCMESGEKIPKVEQSFFELLAKMHGDQPWAIEMDVALGGNVVLNDAWTLAEGSRLHVCKSGCELTGGTNMNANGGTFTLVDCSLLHECYYFGGDGQGIGQDMVNQLLDAPLTPEGWGMAASEEPYPVYLYEDVSWKGELSAPDGVKIALCLNGHTINGNINNDKTSGHIYVMQCGMHSCPILGDTVMALSSGYVELMEDVFYGNGETVSFGGSMNLALLDDITLRYPEVWGLPASDSVTFCTCGYTVTNIEYMRVNGASVQMVDCSDMSVHACAGLNGAEAEYLTNTSLSLMTDSNGMLYSDSDKVLCLLGNISLAKPLIIPEGISVKLCLNGFTLQSPPLGYNGPDDLTTAIYVMPGASLTVCDCSETQTGRIAVNFNSSGDSGWSGLFASAIMNYGSLEIKGGTLVGVMALINAGDAVMDGGNIVGVLGGIAQTTEVTDGIPLADEPSFVMNGGEVHSAGFGIVGVIGDVTVNDGEITAQIAGIGTSFEVDNPSGDAVLYLNGGVINVGKIDAKAYREAGLPVEDEGDTGISADQCVGVVVNTSLVLGGDVTINIEGPLAEEADVTAEIMAGNAAELKAADGVVIENIYEVSTSDNGGAIIVDSSLADNVVPAKACMSTLGESGELTVLQNDGTFVETAIIYGHSLSAKGAIKMNFYIQAKEDFINNPNARVIFMYRGQKTEYQLSDATVNAGYYVFSIDVAAKDYQKNIHCSFTDGTHVWFGGASTINKYLNSLINSTTETVDASGKSSKDIALKMQNYCMAASYHFNVSEVYEPTQEIKAEMDNITEELLSEFAATQSGSSEKLRFAGVSLFLQAETTIRFYFYLNDGVNISDVVITADGVELKTGKNGSAYYVEVTNIEAQRLGKSITMNLDGHIIQYSALSYAYSVLKQGTASQDLLDVAKSLYMYYKAAYEYFN